MVKQITPGIFALTVPFNELTPQWQQFLANYYPDNDGLWHRRWTKCIYQDFTPGRTKCNKVIINPQCLLKNVGISPSICGACNDAI